MTVSSAERDPAQDGPAAAASRAGHNGAGSPLSLDGVTGPPVVPAPGQPGIPPRWTRASRKSAGGPEVYRSPVAVFFWWLWAAFAAANLIDLAIQGHDHFGATVTTVLLLVTGVAYGTALHPRVIADDAGLTVRNPLRDHRIPWGVIRGVDLADSLKLSLGWHDAAGEHTKTVYGWAVHSPRRSRLKAQLRTKRLGRPPSKPSAIYGQLPPEAEALANKTDAENMTKSIEERVSKARKKGAPSGAPTAAWHWPSIAAILVPIVLVLIVALV